MVNSFFHFNSERRMIAVVVVYSFFCMYVMNFSSESHSLGFRIIISLEIVREIVGIKTFSLLQSAIGTFGLNGVDKLLCFMIVDRLQSTTKIVRQQIDRNVESMYGGLRESLAVINSIDRDCCSRLAQIALRMDRLRSGVGFLIGTQVLEAFFLSDSIWFEHCIDLFLFLLLVFLFPIFVYIKFKLKKKT